MEDHKSRLEVLSKRCAETHTSEDIWEHLEEECLELLLAIKRVRRNREPITNVIEELIDVSIECNTVITMINRKDIIDTLLDMKLHKFEKMLNREKEEHEYNGMTLSLVNRYGALPEI